MRRSNRPIKGGSHQQAEQKLVTRLLDIVERRVDKKVVPLRTNIHPTAIVHPNARLGAGVQIGPYAIIGENVEIGDETQVGRTA